MEISLSCHSRTDPSWSQQIFAHVITGAKIWMWVISFVKWVDPLVACWPFSRVQPPIWTISSNLAITNFSQWESSFLWKLRCHWLKFLRHVAKTLVITGNTGAVFTNSLDLRLDSRLGLDPDRVSLETRSGSKSSRIHKGKSSRLG